MSKTIALIVGTRPEVIKLAPLYRELETHSEFTPVLIATGQHQSMAAQAFAAFGISPDHNLDLMDENQTSNSLLSKLLDRLPKVLQEVRPDLVCVQGDTSTSLGAALAAFHLRLPIAHIEAGLRTLDLASPFPEEMNRSVISRMTDYHFAPTKRALRTLSEERTPGKHFLVGNTAVDAVLLMDKLLEKEPHNILPAVRKIVDAQDRRLVLVTGHRRENFEEPLENLCTALLALRDSFEDIHIVYPVHLNPSVQSVVQKRLSNQNGIELTEPLAYPELVYLLKHSALVITDSGGIQEEAPSFGKKVLVTRNCTERQEAIDAGTAILCPLNSPETLIAAAQTELQAAATEERIGNPFGDGDSSQKIVSILARELD